MIIITGGAGFIGSNIVRVLNKLNLKDILIVDSLHDDNKYLNLVNLDIADYIDKNDFIRKCTSYTHNFFGNKRVEVVFHLGACSSTMKLDGRYMMKNNYQYSRDLLSYCVKENIPFIYASSASVYGNKTNIFVEDRKYECPVNIYGYSKFLFDQYVRTISSKVSSQICGLRYFNVYGPNESHKRNMASIIFRIYNKIRNQDNPELFIGSSNFKRDFIYVDDVAKINIWVWKNNISGILNCGTGCAISIQLIANIVLEACKSFYKIKYIPMPKELYRSYQRFTQADIFKLRKLGYKKSFTNVNLGINKYLNWLVHCSD